MPGLQPHHLHLLDLLHQLPGEVEPWPRFLDALRDEIGPDVVTLFAAQPQPARPGLLVGSGLGVSHIQLGDFLGPSVRHPSTAVLPLGAVQELPADHAAFADSVLFREVLEPAGVLPGPGLIVVTRRDGRFVRSAVLVLPTTRRWKPTAAHRVLLDCLAPHMVLTERLQQRLARRSYDTNALRAALDHLVLGVVFLDERRRVAYANRSAADLLNAMPGFAERATLAADEPDERTRAFERLRSSHSDGERGASGYRHPDDRRPLEVLAAPFRFEHHRFASLCYAEAVFIGDPKRNSGDPLRTLRGQFGLTHSQARLALVLVGGHALEEAASLLQISISTARSVLKQVFEKTETHRQADLVRLVLSVFGQVRPSIAPERTHEPAAKR